MTTLVLAEHNQHHCLPATLSTITAAKQFQGDCDVVILGSNAHNAAKMAATLDGVTRIIHIDDEVFAHAQAESIAAALLTMARHYKRILAPSTTFGKNCLPRLAALLQVAQISDVIEIKDDHTFVRPIYAGNALATVRSHDPIQVMTIRTTAFKETGLKENPAPCESRTLPEIKNRSKWLSAELTVLARPELTSAKIIVAGGRALQSADNFKLIETLADQLGAAVGASRAAVDAGYVPNDYQVGQTGKVVAPDLYIAIGISGAVQHLAGMKDSKVIVAINKDPEAPIFQIANYGLVGDLFKILPELISALKK